MSRPVRVPAGMTPPIRHGSIVTSNVSLTHDNDGFFGRECPNPECLAYFKLHVDEYHLAKTAGELSCPVCAVRQDHQTFMTPDQVRRANAAMRELALGTVQDSLARAFGGSRSRGAITFRPAPPRTPMPLPTYLERQTMRTFTCPAGGHRAVIYDRLTVCPYCGPDTPPRAVFEDNLEAMRRLLGVVEHLPDERRQEVEAAGGAPAIAERVLGGIVAAVQTFAKELHSQSGKAPTVRNPWQNPDRLQAQWKATFAADIFAGTTDDQVKLLRLGFARRHILEHNGGVADEKYLRESGDAVALGRRIRFRAPFVAEFTEAVESLAGTLEANA